MAMMIANSKHTVGRMTVTFLMMICLLLIATGQCCITFLTSFLAVRLSCQTKNRRLIWCA